MSHSEEQSHNYRCEINSPRKADIGWDHMRQDCSASEDLIAIRQSRRLLKHESRRHVPIPLACLCRADDKDPKVTATRHDMALCEAGRAAGQRPGAHLPLAAPAGLPPRALGRGRLRRRLRRALLLGLPLVLEARPHLRLQVVKVLIRIICQHQRHLQHTSQV